MSPLSKYQSNLPSREYRLASESRVARINELYNKSQRQHRHRDSIISDNSTSVADLRNDENCYSLSYLPNHAVSPQVTTPVGKETVTIKPEPVTNPFRPLSAEERPFSEDMERELQFTPRLRSRRSIISSRNMSQGTPLGVEEPQETLPAKPLQHTLWSSRQPRVGSVSKERAIRRRETLKELKEKLGKPLPLGYLESESSNKDESFRSNKKGLEERWKRILSNKVYDSNTSNRSSMDDSVQINLPISRISSHNTNNDHNSLATELDNCNTTSFSEGLRTNNEKLDQILALLNDKKKDETRQECMAWIVCIIILVALNLYLKNL